jgi:hypothetical protein
MKTAVLTTGPRTLNWFVHAGVPTVAVSGARTSKLLFTLHPAGLHSTVASCCVNFEPRFCFAGTKAD